MKKVVLLLLITLILPCKTFGATSEDMSVYVRKDVFEVYMQNINSNTEKILDELKSQRQELTSQRQAIAEIRQDISGLSARVENTDSRLSARIGNLDERLSARINGLETGFTARIDGLNSQLSTRIDNLNSRLSARIDGLETGLTARIDGLNSQLSSRIDGLDTRIGDLRNDIYLGLVILGIVISLPMVQKMLQERKPTTPRQTVTLEDVQRLIEENNIKLQQKFTA